MTNPRAVFVGSSNVVPGTWPEKLSLEMGWTCHNYAVGGMGYTLSATDNLASQLQRAASDITFDNGEVEFVFIADGANDARSNADVATAANNTIGYAKGVFPNARVIVLPALWTNSSVDLVPENRAHLMRVVSALRLAATQCRAEYIDGSWSWHLDDASLVKPGEVHYTPAGYDRIVAWVQQYLLGGNTWNNIGWQDVKLGIQYTNPVGATPKIRAMRTGNLISLQGEFAAPQGIINLSTGLTLPYGLRPARNVPIFYAQGGSIVAKHALIGSSGGMTFFGADTNKYNVLINETFSAF